MPIRMKRQHSTRSSMAVANDDDIGGNAHTRTPSGGSIDVNAYNLPSPNSVTYRQPHYLHATTATTSTPIRKTQLLSSNNTPSKNHSSIKSQSNRIRKSQHPSKYNNGHKSMSSSPHSVIRALEFDTHHLPQQSTMQSLSSIVTLNANNRKRIYQGPVDVDNIPQEDDETNSLSTSKNMDLREYELAFPIQYLSLTLPRPQSSSSSSSHLSPSAPTTVSISDSDIEMEDFQSREEEDEHTMTTVTVDSSEDAGDRMSTITLRTTAMHSVQTSASSTYAKERFQETVRSMDNIDSCFHVPDSRYHPTNQFAAATALRQEQIQQSMPVNVDFALESNPKEISSFAQVYMDAKRYAEVIDIYESVLDSCPQYHLESSHSTMRQRKNKRGLRGKKRKDNAPICKETVNFVASTLHNLSVIHLKMENYEKALLCANEVLLLQRQHLEPDDLKIASSLSNLGILYYATEDFNKSLRLLQESLQITSKKVGYADARIASILNNIGCVHFSIGKLIASLASFEESLDIQRNSMGRVPIEDVDRILLNMSFTLCNAGIVSAKRLEYETASSLVEEGLVVQQSVLPDNHRIVISTQYTLADIQKEEARRSALHGNVIDACMQSISLKDSMNSCCPSLQWEESSCKAYRGGDIRIASQSELKSFTDTLKLGSLQDEMTIEERVMILVKAECASDEFLKYQNVYTQHNVIDESEHVEMWNDAADHFRRENLIETIQTLKCIRLKQKDHYGDIHSIVGSTHHCIGMVYLYCEQYALALSEFQEAISIHTAAAGPYHENVLLSMMKAAMAMLLLRDVDNALALFNQVLFIRRRRNGYSHPSLGIVLNYIGACHYELGGLLPSLKSFEEAMEIQRDALLIQKNDQTLLEQRIEIEKSLSETQSNLGFIRFQRGQHGEAIVSFEQALELKRKLWGASSEHILVNETLTNLAFVMASTNCQDNHDKLRDMTRMYVSMLTD